MNKTAFHVHTYRCGHAENISDETYVKKAIELGVKSIWFTDHAPFPIIRLVQECSIRNSKNIFRR